jgi:hypothetical protein
VSNNHWPQHHRMSSYIINIIATPIYTAGFQEEGAVARSGPCRSQERAGDAWPVWGTRLHSVHGALYIHLVSFRPYY